MPPSKGQLRFQADLKSAAEKDDDHISTIEKGDADDEFTFIFSHPNLPDPTCFEIHAQPQELRSYPSENTFLIYTNDNIPPSVAKILEESIFETRGLKVQDMLSNISRRLRVVLDDGGSGEESNDVDTIDDIPFELNSSDDDMPFAYGDDLNDNFFGGGAENVTSTRFMLPIDMEESLTPLLLQRIRRDLQSVLKAGFHVGKICGLEDGVFESIISVSIRLTKLCLSKETYEAWGLSSSDYIILLIKSGLYYTTFEDMLRSPPGLAMVKFRLRKCSKKKPSYQQAQAAFTTDANTYITKEVSQDLGLYTFLVSKSIDELMNIDFASLLRLRKEPGISWDMAREIKHQHDINPSLGSNDPAADKPSTVGGGEEELIGQAQLPPILANDHIQDDGEISLPLVAMQFALRRLVRCTDYCTICHRRVKGNFEALRPYVCSNPLCLHQYMNIGLGPNIDFEIRSQPKVVDLLVSLCYTSLHASWSAGKLFMRDFPTGLNLQVPKILGNYATTHTSQAPLTHEKQISENAARRLVNFPGVQLIDPLDVMFNWDSSTALITDAMAGVTFKEGQWVVISTQIPDLGSTETSMTVLHHARVVAAPREALLPLEVMARHKLPSRRPGGFNLVDEDVCQNVGGVISGHLVFCDADLDELSGEQDKAFSLLIVLSILPSVEDIKRYLMNNQQLSRWSRMSRAALDLLRWIIASNRSYIVQVDDECPTGSRAAPPPDKIYGVDGWVQFRFAQGSVEKETRFNEVLKTINKPQKTLVAWHGSPVKNWHSIIRRGLDYKVTAHGRSFGDGIYFARNFQTSMAYTDGNAQVGGSFWPNSSLQVQTVMSLNELVNLPEEFQSNAPHFVVQYCHWTQCRYLFVQTAVADNSGSQPSTTGEKAHAGMLEFVQDPKWPIIGPRNSRLFIPECAIPSARDRRSTSRVLLADDREEAGDTELVSSDEDEEDIAFLSYEEGHSQKGQGYETDFRPGMLDFSTLPQLPPPSYATSIAQKALGYEIKKLEKIQSTTPLHKLGWYIDFEKMNNMFQWIVEMHSFDSDLPLAQDMKRAGLNSIVLEMLFLREFPMSPPFVRVVRPRFLPFASGGGGHVTAGGAMCMELLTNTGWSPANSMESILLQVRLAICNTDSRPARLETKDRRSMDYNISEAVEAYIRAANAHGWDIPKGLREADASGFT
ncbi:uncharacterized protein F4812DRAFT_174264 [Daldinia caldariorum]|uniref:uncharacterized protein n=1 Tax=Daldinia caldariorum TaxID=326644 RepID=UPI002008C93F|nr:uncharacterized protein F4812DRAFT_174264 [Daldinia caldariorum]KAI1471328.1 hypothetical protein F4812DRAFT_174264 [Daldinia caldariorum]